MRLLGITRVSKESIFSDLNNLEVVTTTSDKYAAAFGSWADIYNPWSAINFLDKGKYGTYWANTSANSLVSKLIREGSTELKMTFERLLHGETIRCPIDEQIVYGMLDVDESAVWRNRNVSIMGLCWGFLWNSTGIIQSLQTARADLAGTM